MKDWNKTGKIKAIILALIALPNIFLPIHSQAQEGLHMVLIPLIFGALITPLNAIINKVIFHSEIVKPHWNDNPLKSKRILSSLHFGAFFFLSIGLSIIIGVLIRFHELDYIGLTAISFGFGILIGISLTLKWTTKKA